MQRTAAGNLALFGLLVTIGVVGRLAQPVWCFTPLAAIAMFAGFRFRLRSVAYLVPFSAILISDFWLPAYQHAAIMLVVYGFWMLPVVLGRTLRAHPTVVRCGAFSLLPATGFWLISNLAVWSFQGLYPPTPAGLWECYAAAIPFYRAMLAGDICYGTLLFGAYLLGSGRTSWWPLAANQRLSRLILTSNDSFGA